MKCPVCKGNSLQKHQLEADLPAYQCRKCEGIWISAAQYWNWLKQRGDQSEPAEIVEVPLPIEETGIAKLCPKCGHFLRGYQVWPNVAFHLDRCWKCESVWFDKNEWAYLKSKGEAHQVRMFFTRAWQQKIWEQESEEWLREMYRERFGEEDYAKIREIRKWLWSHPNHATLTAYLTDKNPYQPIHPISSAYDTRWSK